MTTRDPAILEFEVAFHGQNAHDFAQATSSAVSAKGWRLLLTYDGLPAQEDIDKIQEEKSESLKARPADLTFKLGPDPEKKISP